MSEIIEYIGLAAEVFSSLFQGLISLITDIGTNIGQSYGILINLITFIPRILAVDIFLNLPTVFQIGLTSLFSIFILIFVIKLFQLIKFW